jgi:hypothetical protein
MPLLLIKPGRSLIHLAGSGVGGGHKAGPTHSQYQHGGRSRDAVEMRRLVTALTRNVRGSSGSMDS